MRNKMTGVIAEDVIRPGERRVSGGIEAMKS